MAAIVISCRMLMHGKLPRGEEPATSLLDMPVIDFEPTEIFGTNLAPGSQTASAEDFCQAAENLRAALESDRDLPGDLLHSNSNSPHSRTLDISVVKVCSRCIVPKSDLSRANELSCVTRKAAHQALLTAKEITES